MLSALHALDPLPVPPLLAVKILDHTLGPHSEPQSWRAWLGLDALFRAAAVCLRRADGVHHHDRDFPGVWDSAANRPTIADLNPVNVCPFGKPAGAFGLCAQLEVCG